MPFDNWTDTTSTYIFVLYEHSKKEIIIIPEGLSHLLSLFMIAGLTIVILGKPVYESSRRLKNWGLSRAISTGGKTTFSTI